MKTEFKCVIFDLDGVITQTAKIHGLAWERTFNEFLKTVDKSFQKPFDHRSDDYLKYVDGKPRYDGVKSFLESRGIELPFGQPDDPPTKRTICGLGNRKNVEFQEVLKEEGVEVYPTSIELIKELKRRGKRVGVASSSKNCLLILRKAGIEHLFETRVDGVVTEKLKLRGKPEPDIFVQATRNLGCLLSESVVVEDSVSGVQAGRKGNFGFVLGVARAHNAATTLLSEGADRVVTDLGEITVDEIEYWFDKKLEIDSWELKYYSFDANEERLRETLTTVGNGYIGSRGNYEGEKDDWFVHYPGNYIAGIFNKVPTRIADRMIYNNDMVNCPNWTLIEYKIGHGQYRSPLKLNILSYAHILHMREAIMERVIVCKDELDRIMRVNIKRLVSMANPHICAIQFSITPVNFSEKISIRAAIDGTVINNGVARYRGLTSKHLEAIEEGEISEGVFLEVQTNLSKYQIVTCQKILVYENDKLLDIKPTVESREGWIGQIVEIDAKEAHSYKLEKIVSIFTSNDKNVQDPKTEAEQVLHLEKDFEHVRYPHIKSWKLIWDTIDIRVDGDRFVQKVARLHLYHLIVSASPHNKSLDVEIAARGLSGESYRGHYFWDTIFIMPFYTLHFPEVAKAFLLHRYKRLDAARAYARQYGFKGAMYPWQSADTGEEETQELHYNPLSKTWGPDLSRLQRHVSIAIYYNCWRYIKETDDMEFFERYGDEMMIEIARFWSSAAKYDEKDKRYHIANVMGPDEFHEKLPGSKEPGLRDNAYTNIMTSWLLEQTAEMVRSLPERAIEKLQQRIGFNKDELKQWDEISRKLKVNFQDDIIEQFEGYFGLKEVDWEYYRKKYKDIHRMDRILKAEGDSPDNYKVGKQADVLMTFYLLQPEEVQRVLNRMGYKIKDPIELLKKNYDYYEKRCSHGSTLSRIVHAVVSSQTGDEETAWQWFLDAMASDLHDTQGGTTTEGIHAGVMGGTIDVMVRYFAGVDFSYKHGLSLNPHLAKHWNQMKMKLMNRKVRYSFDFVKEGVTIRHDSKKEIPAKVLGKKVILYPKKDNFIPYNHVPQVAENETINV